MGCLWLQQSKYFIGAHSLRASSTGIFSIQLDLFFSDSLRLNPATITITNVPFTTQSIDQNAGPMDSNLLKEISIRFFNLRIAKQHRSGFLAGSAISLQHYLKSFFNKLFLFYYVCLSSCTNWNDSHYRIKWRKASWSLELGDDFHSEWCCHSPSTRNGINFKLWNSKDIKEFFFIPFHNTFPDIPPIALSLVASYSTQLKNSWTGKLFDVFVSEIDSTLSLMNENNMVA